MTVRSYSELRFSCQLCVLLARPREQRVQGAHPAVRRGFGGQQGSGGVASHDGVMAYLPKPCITNRKLYKEWLPITF